MTQPDQPPAFPAPTRGFDAAVEALARVLDRESLKRDGAPGWRGANETRRQLARERAARYLDVIVPLLDTVADSELARAWQEGRDSVGLDFLKMLGPDGKRPATPNPYAPGGGASEQQ